MSPTRPGRRAARGRVAPSFFVVPPEVVVFAFWIDPSFLSLDAIAAAVSGLVVFVNVLFCRPA